MHEHKQDYCIAMSRTLTHFADDVSELPTREVQRQLTALGWGYRAPRIFTLARQLAERGDEAFLDGLALDDEDSARAALAVSFAK